MVGPVVFQPVLLKRSSSPWLWANTFRLEISACIGEQRMLKFAKVLSGAAVAALLSSPVTYASECPQFGCKQNKAVFYSCIEKSQLNKAIAGNFCHCFVSRVAEQMSFSELVDAAAPVDEEYTEGGKSAADRLLKRTPLAPFIEACNELRKSGTLPEAPEEQCYKKSCLEVAD